MSICVFSRKGILYNKDSSGTMMAIAVPSVEQKRQYSDISNPTARTVKDRYGLIEGEILYRVGRGGNVTVYGSLPKELYEERQEVNVYLPEDLVADDIGALYYVMGEKLIIHSVRTIELDGSATWNSIFIELENKGSGILNVIENLISERIVSNSEEKIVVAYTGLSYADKEELYTRVNQFGAIIEPLEKLTEHKNKTPIYRHKDNTVMMAIFVSIAIIMFTLAISYYISGQKTLSRSNDKIKTLRVEFKKSLTNRRLKNVSNPQDVKNFIEKTFKSRPSSIIHAGGEVASLFGTLNYVTLEKNRMERGTKTIENKPEDNVIYVIASVKEPHNSLLIDQERLAKSVYETRKWIRSIERSSESGDGSVMLKIGVYVGDDGDL